MGVWYDLKVGFNPRYKGWVEGWVVVFIGYIRVI